jgi:hypothetical protein
VIGLLINDILGVGRVNRAEKDRVCDLRRVCEGGDVVHFRGDLDRPPSTPPNPGSVLISICTKRGGEYLTGTFTNM